ncbi:Deleted in lung and esophageal cancer protein 1, partial [Branchiostoma belcheri]
RYTCSKHTCSKYTCSKYTCSKYTCSKDTCSKNTFVTPVISTPVFPATAMSLVQTPGTEPPMYLQRPSSGRSQDISHVLASTFRELFTRDVVTPDTVKYLNTSRHGDDVYHERYVEDLRKIQAERERRMQEVSMLERHIIQARARATSADERALNRVAEGYNTYHDLGLPPVRSHFCYLLDSDLLKRHGLLVPEHFSTQEPPPQNPPEPVELPNYARDTLTFHEHVSTSPVDDGYDDPDELPRKEVKRSPKTRVTPEESRPKTIKEGLREVWKEAMPPVSRVQERSVLANLEERHNFLRNPRHIPPSAPHGGRTLVKKKKKLPKLVGGRSVYVEESPVEKEPAVVFVASPSEVVFRQYSVGQVYEMILDLKNVTTASRQCRVIPPKTSYFSVGLGQFPGDQGIVAPGMSCQYTVRFAPDSLADYDDCVQVQTQSATPMYIKIKGRREPPALTLPSVLDCGHCLVGGCRVVQFLCRNDGGPGRFCLMPKNLWPTANYRSISTPGRVELAPFEVRPAVFQLMPGEAILLEILFAPTSIKTFNQAVTMVCDNCQVKHFTVKGVGQTAGVEMMMVAGGESEPLPGEILDATARHLVRFDSVHPMTFAQRTMAIRNTTDVELPFHWQIVKPTLEPPDAGEGEKVSENIECYPDVGTAFSVIPEGGVLQPSNTEEFLVTFAPTQEETSYNSVLHMILHHIPEVPHPEDTTPRDRPPTPEGKADMHRQKSSDSLASQSSSKTSEDGLRLRDVIALEVELKGTCRTFNVLLDPYAIIVPGQLLMSTVIKKHFRMINTSQWMLSFSWESLSDPHILEVEPPAGHIEAGDVMEMQLSITGGQPGVLEHRLLCHIQNRSEPISLYIRANIKTPSLDFGLVQPGDVVVREIHIRNTCQIRAAWSLQESAAFLETEDGNVLASEFELTPSSGELPPLGSLAVRAVFKPARCRSVRTVFVLMVPNGPDSHVSAQVEVQTPQVCLMSCQLVIDEIYTDVPVRREITLLNQTLLETDFTWGQPEGPHADRCSVEFGTPSGHLGPREKVNITVTFTGHTQGEISEVRIPCQIQGMADPVYLTVFCQVRGLTVSYNVSKEPELQGEDERNDLVLDFGTDVEIHGNPRRFLHITNHTAIVAPFSIHVDYFHARPPSPPGRRRAYSIPSLRVLESLRCQQKSLETGTLELSRRQLLGRTPNIADPLSKTPSKSQVDFSQALLRDGRGAAFLVQPAAGVLMPFHTVTVEITSYSDIWGQYQDHLICKVKDLAPVSIPVRMTVVGCPLNFQMTAAFRDQQPVVRYGTHVSGVAPIARTMRVNNPCPYAIRLDWQSYNHRQQDPQLLDLMVSYGQDFPLRDAHGDEIVPPEQAKVAMWQSYNHRQQDPQLLDLMVSYGQDFPIRDAHGEEIVPPEVKESPRRPFETPDTLGTTPALGEVVEDEPTDSPQEEAQAPGRRKVVLVNLRPHEGQRANQPYDITPKQLVIPARSHGNIKVTFTPLHNQDVDTGIDCNAFALGFMSLDSKVALSVPSKVSRVQGYQMTPLRLEMTAHVKPAQLTLEPADEEGMLSSEFLKTTSCTVTNKTETPLQFRLVTTPPFLLTGVEVAGVRGRAFARTQASGFYTLNPRQNMKVSLAFRVSMDLVQLVDKLAGWREGDKMWLTHHGGERRLHFTQNMVIEFNNGTTQNLPLRASLVVPSISLSTEAVDFGVCMVEQEREMDILIANPTASDCYWTATIESKDDDQAFQVTPASGLLQGALSHIAQNKALLKLNFTARHSKAFECVIIFQGVLGEEVRRLQVKGHGSYDGRHEAIMDI